MISMKMQKYERKKNNRWVDMGGEGERVWCLLRMEDIFVSS